MLHILLALLCGWSDPTPKTGPWSWLEAGQYPVGYRVVPRYDQGRSAKPKYDFEGKRIPNVRALPIQISMWYPAQTSRRAAMTHGDYVNDGLAKESFGAPTEEQQRASREGLKFITQFEAGINLTDEQVEAIYSTSMRAVRDAAPAKGSFPLLIVGTDGGPQTNALLWEYLASQGYVVLLTPSIQRDATRQASAPQSVLADRINNLEFLFAFAHTLSNVDHTKLGAIGVNFDGMSAMLYQCKNGEADAVVSIDGWEGKSGGVATVKESIFFDANQFRSPYFVVEQHDPSMGPPLDLSTDLVESILYADRYWYVYRNMKHGHLIGNLYLIPMMSDEMMRAYKSMFESIGHFLNAYVKKDAREMDMIQSRDETLVEQKLIRKSLQPIPSPVEFEDMVMRGEFEHLKDVISRALRDNPHAILTTPQQLNLFHFRYRQRNQLEDARKVRELGVLLFPTSVEALCRLAEASDKNTANELYSKALTLIDSDASLTPEKRASWRNEITKKVNDQK